MECSILVAVLFHLSTTNLKNTYPVDNGIEIKKKLSLIEFLSSHFMKCPIPSIRSLRSLLRSCTRHRVLSAGKQLHSFVLTTGAAFSSTSFLLNAIFHLYGSCGLTHYARKMFDKIPNSHKDTADWTALLTCLAQHGNSAAEPLNLFKEMMEVGIVIDDVVIVCTLSLCAKVEDLCVGRQVHGYVEKMGLGISIKVGNALLNMYGKCGLVSEVRSVFGSMEEKNVVSWTTLLDGVVKWEGVEEGRELFDKMPDRNEVGWTIMVAGYIAHGFSKEGFLLLNEMILLFGLRLNYVTLCSILMACAQSGDVNVGRWVHVYALKAFGREMNIKVGTALVDMYAKCGRIDCAHKVFGYLPERNVVAWNVMLGGFAMHGKGGIVLDMFPRMIEEAKPDDLTFMAVLTSCSHSGFVDQGYHYFRVLESIYGITPKMEHYACMVDLLGKAGRLEEAMSLIKKMPMPPNEVVLGSVLGSCSFYGTLELGEQLLQELIQTDSHSTEYYILLSNMYALAGKQNKANSLRQALKAQGIRKQPGISSIHINGQVHHFSAGDKSHPRIQEVYFKLDDMIQKLQLAGYKPNTSAQVFSGCDGGEHNPEQAEEKEQALFAHSEKLAICFGLMTTKPGSPLYIFKNLRTCRDCHSAIKVASKVYKREIVVRDRNRFHCFKNGSCSCCDYW